MGITMLHQNSSKGNLVAPKAELLFRHHDNLHNDTRHNDTQHNDTQHNDTQHNGGVMVC
jgi:hypothetical protein